VSDSAIKAIKSSCTLTWYNKLRRVIVSRTFVFAPASTKHLIASVKPFFSAAFAKGLKDLDAFKSAPAYKI
jgi:hypothetical protein